MTECEQQKQRYIFPPWTNYLLVVLVVAALGTPPYLVLAIGLGASAENLNVGYQPIQPVEYSHQVHVGELGMDCRYCHNTVEQAAHAAIPHTQICMNCHANILPQSDKLNLVRQSYYEGTPIKWIKVHDLPDYVYFDHSAHVSKGIGCVSCHGRIDKTEVVYQAEPLSMAWCLDCHRSPEKHLRPVDFVTDMEYVPHKDQIELGLELKRKLNIKNETELTSCTVCHR